MRNRTYTIFSQDVNVDFDLYKKEMIKNDIRDNNASYEYFTGIAYKLTGSMEHFCDCEFCDKEYEYKEEMFTSKEEANKYIKSNKIFGIKLEEYGYYKKAVRQNNADFGLFEKAE